jgi:hypothetical protein
MLANDATLKNWKKYSWPQWLLTSLQNALMIILWAY